MKEELKVAMMGLHSDLTKVRYLVPKMAPNWVHYLVLKMAPNWVHDLVQLTEAWMVLKMAELKGLEREAWMVQMMELETDLKTAVLMVLKMVEWMKTAGWMVPKMGLRMVQMIATAL